MNRYEGMFLFDPGATPKWENVEAELNRLMERVNARVISSIKWDERRLAYEIRGRRRGLYALTYFEADAARIAELERDARLSEAVLRCLVLRIDHLTEEQMKEQAEAWANRPPEPEDRRDRRDHRDHRDRRESRERREHREGRESRPPRSDADAGRGRPSEGKPAASPPSPETPADGPAPEPAPAGETDAEAKE